MSLAVDGANLNWTQNLFSSSSQLWKVKLFRPPALKTPENSADTEGKNEQDPEGGLEMWAISQPQMRLWLRDELDLTPLGPTAGVRLWSHSAPAARVFVFTSCSSSVFGFFRFYLYQRDPSGRWDVRTHFIKVPSLQESTECFYGNHGNQTTDFGAMILWCVNLWFNAVNTWCHRSKNERQFSSWSLQRTLFSVLWVWSFNISSVYCFVLENQEIKV